MTIVIKEAKSDVDHKCCLCGEIIKAGRTHIYMNYVKEGNGIEAHYHLFKICQIDKGSKRNENW